LSANNPTCGLLGAKNTFFPFSPFFSHFAIDKNENIRYYKCWSLSITCAVVRERSSGAKRGAYDDDEQQQ
jgi:hypothetical protein